MGWKSTIDISREQAKNLILAANNILKEGRRSSGDITGVETEVTKSMKRLEKQLVII